MKVLIIRILGFFIGFFITLFIINYLNIQNKKVEKFDISIPSLDTYNNLQSLNITSNTNINTSNNIIPYFNYKYMCINTFNDIKKISNSDGRWYESDLKETDYNKTINQYHYFTYNKTINLKANNINNVGSYGANIYKIELDGPKSFYFANNTITNELNEFSMILTINIKDINAKNNILFEMVGNTETINNDEDMPKYSTSIVNINIKTNENNNYDFILTIGDIIYRGNINNIDKNIIINSDYLVLGLIYSSTEIIFYINKQRYKYNTINNFIIKLGSMPLILNKNGLINMELYNFIYYKAILPESEYLKIFAYNNFYLSGLNNVIKTAENNIKQTDNNQKCKTEEEVIENSNLNKRLIELENKLGKCIDNKPYNEDIEIKPFDLNINEKIKNMSSNFFSFLF